MLPTKKTIKYVAGQDDTNVDSDDTEGVTCKDNIGTSYSSIYTDKL